MGNDDQGDGPAIVEAVTQATNGNVTVNPDGTVIYTPNPEFIGNDSYTYTIKDSNGDTSTATVNVLVNEIVIPPPLEPPVNLLPQAVNDNISTNENVSVTTPVLNNDAQGNGPATVTNVTQGTDGAVTIDPYSREVIYTPKPGFVGNDSYTYTIRDSDGDTSTATVNVTVNATRGSVSGQVRLDSDRDGDLNDSDDGISNVTVELWTDPNGDGKISDGSKLTTTTTDADGSYHFENLPTGNYVVREQNPTGYSSSADSKGRNDNLIPVDLITTDDSTDNDFLDILPNAGNISGQVRFDSDADGDLNDLDNGINAVSINLYSDVDGNGQPDSDTPIATTTTDENGNYIFEHVEPGNYVVVKSNPKGYHSTKDSQDANDDKIALSVLEGESNTGNDFLDAIPINSISGQVRLDGDADLNDDESSANGVSINLYSDVDGNGQPDSDTPIATTMTDENGNYSFKGVEPGNYVVVESNPAGYDSTADTQGANDDRIAVSVTDGGSSTGNDFLGTIPESSPVQQPVQPPAEQPVQLVQVQPPAEPPVQLVQVQPPAEPPVQLPVQSLVQPPVQPVHTPVLLPETPQAQVESLSEGGIDLRLRETSVVEIIQTRYESSDTYQTLVGNNLLRDVAIDSRQVRVLRFGNETDMPVFQYIDPAVKDEMYRIYRDYNHGELGEIIHYGVFESIGREIENLRWQSDYWLWNDGEGSHANFTFL